MAEMLPIRHRNTIQSINQSNSEIRNNDFSNSLKRFLKFVIMISTKYVITDSKIRFNEFLNSFITGSTKFVRTHS